MWKRNCCNIGLNVANTTVFILVFADDLVVTPADENDMLNILRIPKVEQEPHGLGINTEKAEYMVVGVQRRGLVPENKIVRSSLALNI